MSANLTGAWRGGSRDGLAGWRVTFAYDEDTIANLKRTIPADCREWNEEQKYWWVAIEFEGALVKLFPAMEGYLAQGSLF